MKYIKVTNQVKEVNRLGLEKLGLSTKRENNETIGQFGSGIKFAPIAAIRKGMDWAFAGSDKKGKYVLQYVVKDDDDIPCIFYKYDDYEKPSSFTSEAGVLSWKNDFQIYREVVANAMDEHTLNGLPWSINIVDVDKIESVEGEFSVYFTATDEMLKIHRDFDKYFSVNREPLYEGKTFTLYEPYDASFRVYTKGVLVFTDEDNESLQPMEGYFDYEFNDIELNEERTVASTWNMNLQIVRALAEMKDSGLVEDVLIKMVNDQLQNSYETNNIPAHIFGYAFLTNETWNDTFETVYPKSVIVEQKDLSFNVEKTIQSRGYSAVEIDHEGVYNFLTSQKVATAGNIFGETFKYDYTMDIDQYTRLNNAIDIVENVFPQITLNNIVGVYMEDEDSDVQALGMTLSLPSDDEYDEKSKVILVSESHIQTGTIEEIVGTLIHEYDHYSTGVGDGDMEGRLFRSLADSKIGNLTCEIFKLRHGLESIE